MMRTKMTKFNRDMKKNKLIIADIASHNTNGKSYGHYFSVAENYRSTLDCTIVGGPIYDKKFDNVVCLPYDTKNTDSIIVKKWKQLKNCKNLFETFRNDTIILQHAALATAIIGIIFFKPKSIKLFLITYNGEGYNRPLMKILYRIAKKKIDGVICPFEFVGKNYGVPFIVLPDYLYSEKQFHTPANTEKKYDLCIVGNITPEKGVLDVIELAVKQKVSLIIAGRVTSKELETELYTAIKGHRNIMTLFKYLSEEEYCQIISSSKYCVLNYQDKSYGTRSSGVAYDLLFRGIPIIGRHCTALDFIEEHGMGALFDNIADADLPKLLQKENEDVYKQNIEKYKALHKQYINLLKEFVAK